MNILIIEDNEKIAINIGMVLENENYYVDIAHNGNDGLKKTLKQISPAFQQGIYLFLNYY